MFDDKIVLKLLQQNPVYKSALKLATTDKERKQIEEYVINIVKTTLEPVIEKTNESQAISEMT